MARVFKIAGIIATVCVAGVLGGFIVIVNNGSEVREAKTAAQANNKILDIIVAVTGCNPNDPPEACKDRMRVREVSEGTRRIIEVDCIHRRSHAGLPAPEPSRFCTEQTPPEVYPGR